MKRTGENVVIGTFADCLLAKAQRPESEQKEPSTSAVEIAKAFGRLDIMRCMKW